MSYVVHCPLSEVYLMYQIYFRQWPIFSITLEKLIHFVSCYTLLLFPCHAGQAVITLSSADPGGRAVPTATCLLVLRVRIPPVAWMSVGCENLHVVGWRSLRRADHLSGGVLTMQSVLSVIAEPHRVCQCTRRVEQRKKNAIFIWHLSALAQ